MLYFVTFPFLCGVVDACSLLLYFFFSLFLLVLATVGMQAPYPG